MNCREFRSRVFTPFVTLLIFIKQVLCPDKSCKQAITDFISEQSSKGNDIIPSANTGPYSKARQRLPETTVHDLVKETGGNSSENTDSGWKIYGREVKAFDGTTVKMADSEANQAEFPQHSNQKKGAGFPIARLLVIVSLLNSKKYHKKELAKIYKLRWHIEINLNSIKTIMRMDMLSCKSPEMVKKEIGVHLLAYNIIRIIIAEACQKHGMHT